MGPQDRRRTKDQTTLSEQVGLDIDTISQLQKRVRVRMLASQYPQDADDACQEYVLQILQGKAQHQNIDFFCIDFIRKERTGKHPKTNRCPIEIAPDLFEKITGINGAQKVEEATDYRKVMEKIMTIHNHQHRRVMILHFLFDFNLSEIAAKENVSQQRINQIVRRCLFYLKRKIHSQRLSLK